MAENDVRGLSYINRLQKIYFCPKKKCMYSFLVFCLILFIFIIINWSSQMDIYHVITPSRQEDDFNNFDKLPDTTRIVWDNLLTNFSGKHCFTLLLKKSTSAARKRVSDNTFYETNAVENDNKQVQQTNQLNPFGRTNGDCHRYVLLGGTMGRIGNQMFEVAAVIGMAMKNDMIPIIQENILLGKYFHLPNQVEKIRTDMTNVRNCKCDKASFYYNCTDEFHSGGNVSMHGYLQSWKYFVHAEIVIRSIFMVKDAYLTKAKEYIRSIYFKGHQLVCLHVRRGDMTTQAAFKFGYVLPNMTFIEKAKRFYTNKYDKVQFLIVSEDKPWCREHFRDIHISPFTDPGVELALLMSCNHVIVTGGSYGWWGAWLAGGSVVYFNGHQRPNSNLELETNRTDYYPPSWIGMSQNPE